jgi:hypothetical protein
MAAAVRIFKATRFQLLSATVPDRIGGNRTPECGLNTARAERVRAPVLGVEINVLAAREVSCAPVDGAPVSAALSEIMRHVFYGETIPSGIEPPCQPACVRRLSDKAEKADGGKPLAQA